MVISSDESLTSSLIRFGDDMVSFGDGGVVRAAGLLSSGSVLTITLVNKKQLN